MIFVKDSYYKWRGKKCIMYIKTKRIFKLSFKHITNLLHYSIIQYYIYFCQCFEKVIDM